MTVSLPVELPDNLSACHAIILRQAEVIEELFARIERLNRDLATLKRQLFGSRRERFVAGSGEDRAGEDVAVAQRGFQTELPADAWQAQTSASAPPRTSQGRQRRVIDASIPREKVLHPLDERNVPPELWNDPRAKRFFRCYELIAAASGNRIIAVGCWAHARRKFAPLIESGPGWTSVTERSCPSRRSVPA